MKRTLVLGVTMMLVVFIAAACSMDQFPLLQSGGASSGSSAPTAESIVAQAPTPVASAEPASADANAEATAPAFSVLTTPTALPTMAGPMGTLTAIADMVASPTQNTEPYTIVNKGKPHFIEFHAWW